ncbi:hypothetical protein AYO44_08650 [Planctomycetaceae bacterium SCGC AG-212-F19]|nr:hypothetical protein AYO44_08650 [Planctomycetaceae bacterium SCGC AG-212-F19]
MADPQLPDPVKLLVAVLWADALARDEAVVRLTAIWGQIDCTGPDRPFDMTDYYAPEMGPVLHRRLVAFAELVAPESIREAKLRCNSIETELAEKGQRRVNLDVGYLDHNKLVLASAKNAGQKIHLGGGIYADLIGRFKAGRYQPFDWTFPDFKDARYDPELATIRQTYLEQLRRRKV